MTENQLVEQLKTLDREDLDNIKYIQDVLMAYSANPEAKVFFNIVQVCDHLELMWRRPIKAFYCGEKVVIGYRYYLTDKGKLFITNEALAIVMQLRASKEK